jgi:hypothetical protein
MAKRKSGGNRTTKPANTAAASEAAATTDPVEQRVVAFAEQLGRIVGTVQARAEGWMDRDALNAQIAGVRDSASELLDQLKATVGKGATAVTGAASDASEAMKGAKKTAGAAARAAATGRSGGVVDAPGKKHRKPMPSDARAMAADTKRNVNRGRQAFVRPGKRNGRG